MDRFGGSFSAYDDAHDDAGPFGLDHADEIADCAPEAPVSPVGQDERRMQVRAYNHWAALLGNGNFPDIADLQPENLGDFGPHGVLLHFKDGIEDPAIKFLGAKLSAECGGEANFARLSDVPSRSLLSRITDHYLQIIANQAPIGFEAEFINDRGTEVLYRGILLPWSSDGTTIDYIFGVINWKELADAATADALLNAIDAAFEAPVPPYQEKDMDRMLDLSGFSELGGDEADDGDAAATPLPTPAFGAPAEAAAPFELTDEAEDEDFDEDTGETSEWGAGFSGFGDEDKVYAVDYGDQGLEDGEGDEDVDGVIDPLGDDTASLGLASLVSRSGRVKQSVQLPGMDSYEPTSESVARTTLEQRVRAAIPQAYEPEDAPAAIYTPGPIEAGDEITELEGSFEETEETGEEAGAVLELAEEQVEEVATPVEAEAAPAATFEDEPEGLYDCLAAARELAQTARSNEDRGRKALYQAVARAYDFSLEASANPEDFAELCAENGLTVQDRAPMTPVVKLVFGTDYDKTRLTEYATVLGYAHRTGIARGTLDKVLASAEGGLKGVVQAERAARKEAEGKPVAARSEVRKSLAKKLRKIEAIGFEELEAQGSEFALVMVRRLPTAELVVLGEVPEDLALVEKAAKKLLG